jgi:gluconate 5-dehydrogenase
LETSRLKTLDLFDLTGKRALVTGSSRGIGLALARGLAGAGADIVLNSRDPQALGLVAEDLVKDGINVKAVAFDVTDAEGAEEAIAYCEAEIGPIDILVNNAGIQHRAPLEGFLPEKFDEIMRANVTSAFLVGQAVAKRMIPRGRGKIINTCSVMSALARPSIAPYTTSKGALASLTKGMAVDWAKHGLNVNGVAPGYFRTELNQALVEDAEFTAWLEKRTPMGRWGNVEELVGAAVFLASDASSFVNGHILYVDGGMTASV